MCRQKSTAWPGRRDLARGAARGNVSLRRPQGDGWRLGWSLQLCRPGRGVSVEGHLLFHFPGESRLGEGDPGPPLSQDFDGLMTSDRAGATHLAAEVPGVPPPPGILELPGEAVVKAAGLLPSGLFLEVGVFEQ